jgi:hypothetical protein
MNVIGIDIAVKGNVTLAYEWGHKWIITSHLPNNWHGIGLRLSLFFNGAVDADVAIEKPYLATFANSKGQRKQAVRTFGDLSEVYGQIVLLCLQAGFEREHIHAAPPKDWMPAMLAVNGQMPKGKGAYDERKRLSVFRAHNDLGVPGCDVDDWENCHDRADAALISVWMKERLRLERMERGEGW